MLALSQVCLAQIWCFYPKALQNEININVIRNLINNSVGSQDSSKCPNPVHLYKITSDLHLDHRNRKVTFSCYLGQRLVMHCYTSNNI